MTAFIAIIQDTWRQSKHQWVLILLMALVSVYVVLSLVYVSVRQAPDGREFLGTIDQEDSDQSGWGDEWNGVYADALRHELGYEEELARRSKDLNALLDQQQKLDYDIALRENANPDDPELPKMLDQRRELERERDRRARERFELTKYINEEVRRVTKERTSDLTDLEKGVEYWLSTATTFLFTLSMLGFIATCAGYVPQMIESGSIDLVLSKPIRRWHVYFGKYLGGLLLYSCVLCGAYVVLFVGAGLKTGLWHWRFFGGLPMTIFSLALLFSIIAWVGLWTRSTGMAMVLGYVYYIVIDTVVAALGDRASLPMLADMPGLEQVAEIVKTVFPSFKWLRESAEGAVMSVNIFPWKHVVVGVAWLVVCLGTAYNRFRINDY